MIDPSAQLAALIRAQFAAQLGREFKNSRAAPPNAVAPDAPNSQGGASSSAVAGGQKSQDELDDDSRIKQLIALRVRALSPDDPQRRRKAFRLFLEGVLMQEFGRERLGEDKGFDQIVDSVLKRMNGDADLRAAMDEAGDLLLTDTSPNRGAS